MAMHEWTVFVRVPLLWMTLHEHTVLNVEWIWRPSIETPCFPRSHCAFASIFANLHSCGTLTTKSLSGVTYLRAYCTNSSKWRL
jgi:hypothetical protein